MTTNNQNDKQKNEAYKNLLNLKKQLKETTYEEFLKRPGGKFPPKG